MTPDTRLPAALTRPGIALAALALALAPAPALAYIGPGIAVGTVVLVAAMIGSVVLALLALFWYPLKRLWRRLRRPSPGERSRP